MASRPNPASHTVRADQRAVCELGIFSWISRTASGSRGAKAQQLAGLHGDQGLALECGRQRQFEGRCQNFVHPTVGVDALRTAQDHLGAALAMASAVMGR